MVPFWQVFQISRNSSFGYIISYWKWQSNGRHNLGIHSHCSIRKHGKMKGRSRQGLGKVPAVIFTTGASLALFKESAMTVQGNILHSLNWLWQAAEKRYTIATLNIISQSRSIWGVSSLFFLPYGRLDKI